MKLVHFAEFNMFTDSTVLYSIILDQLCISFTSSNYPEKKSSPPLWMEQTKMKRMWNLTQTARNWSFLLHTMINNEIPLLSGKLPRGIFEDDFLEGGQWRNKVLRYPKKKREESIRNWNKYLFKVCSFFHNAFAMIKRRNSGFHLIFHIKNGNRLLQIHAKR